jgi:hypothetical protein
VLDRPVVTAGRIDPAALESVEIDRQVREDIKDGRSLYAVDAQLIERLAPDVMVTEDLCARSARSARGRQRVPRTCRTWRHRRSSWRQGR